jgi:hypothetical protein
MGSRDATSRVPFKIDMHQYKTMNGGLWALNAQRKKNEDNYFYWKCENLKF